MQHIFVKKIVYKVNLTLILKFVLTYVMSGLKDSMNLKKIKLLSRPKMFYTKFRQTTTQY